MTTYQVFTKHALKLQKKGKHISRPVLQGIYHTDTQVVITDSHRLMRADITFPSYLNKIVDPKTGQEIEGNYPNTERLVPSPDKAKEKFTINLKETSAFLKAVKSLKIESIDFTINPDTNKVTIKASNNLDTVHLSLDTMYAVHPDKFTNITCNTSYLLDACEWLKEYGNQADIWVYGSMRPFLLTPVQDTHNALALVLPIRKY